MTDSDHYLVDGLCCLEHPMDEPLHEEELTMKQLILIISFTFLAGCQNIFEVAKDENSPYYLVPVGSKLILNQELTIPVGKAGIYIQNGKALPNANYRQYYSHCRFELLTVSETTQSVKPDEFIIHKVTRERGFMGHTNRIQLAGLNLIAGMGDKDSGRDDEFHGTLMYLRSERQPDVYRIYCGEWGELFHVRLMSIRDIRKQLDKIFTLELII